jgi:glycosyltransferase involved in cell wall biosynthesis
MRPVKRPLDLIDAFAAVRSRAALVVVGEGPLFEEVRRRAASYPAAEIHLVGTRRVAELPRCYAAADAFALTSEHEVNPLVIREAMCFRLPLVVSDQVRVLRDFVFEGENGYSYPMGDVGALADRLDRVLSDPVATARMGARSREIIGAWSYDVTVAGVVDALSAVARPR